MRLSAIGLLLLTLTACAGGIEVPQQTLYTQTNMRMEPRGGEMSTINYRVWSLLPMCTPVRLESANEEEVDLVLVESGKRAHLVRYGKSLEPMHTTLSKLFQPTCPDKTTLSAIDQEGIAKGEVLPGMSKQGVLLALGYPPDHRTASLELDEWTYWQNRTRSFEVQFENGVVVLPPEAPAPATAPAAAPVPAEPTPQIMYTFSNLHADTDGEISSVNYRSLATVPRCAQVELVDVGKKKVKFKLAETGVVYTYAINGDSRLPMDKHLERVFVPSCDAPTTLNDADRKGIESGTVLPGMTKQGVLMAVGYPPDHKTASIDANEWTFWKSRYDEYKVVFSNGVVEKIVD